MKAGMALTTLMVAAGLTLIAGKPLPVAAEVTPNYGSCTTWHDSNTFGAACSGGGGAAYQAVAVCKNGKVVGGPYRGGESRDWSYAYCTSVNSSLDHGYVQWYL